MCPAHPVDIYDFWSSYSSATQGFLCVDKLHSLKVGDTSILDDHMAISVRKRIKDQYREGHTVYIAKSGKVTCPVATARRVVVHLTGSS